MRTHFLLFLSLAVVVGLPVQDWVPVESLGKAQREQNPLLADLLPEQGHVILEDPKPVAIKKSQEKQAKLQTVQKAKILVEDVPLVKKDEEEANEIMKGTKLKEEPVLEELRDQKEVPTEQVENTPLLNVMPETAEEDLLAEKPVIEQETVPEAELFQRNLNDLMEEESNVIQEDALTEAEEPMMSLENVQKGQEVLDTNLEAEEDETFVGEERKVLQEEALMEAEEQVLGLEPVPKGYDMNANEFVEDELIEPGEMLGEEERNAMREEALLEASYIPEEVPVMELDPQRAEISAMLDEAPMGSSYQMAEDLQLQIEPSQEFLMQEYLQKDEEKMMDYQTGEEELMMNEKLRKDERQATEVEPVEEEPSNYRWQTCYGVAINGKCYEFFKGPKRAADAEFFCQSYFPKGHLASVTSSYIHNHMMELMDKNGGRTRTYIGGLRYLDTGRFIWLDGEQWGYNDWLPGEPNNNAGVEDCVELMSNGKFNDMPCWDLRAFICSYPY